MKLLQGAKGNREMRHMNKYSNDLLRPDALSGADEKPWITRMGRMNSLLNPYRRQFGLTVLQKRPLK